MSPLSAPTLASGLPSQDRSTDRAQLAAAARQFEAIFVRQMLAAARKTQFGEDVLGSQGMETFRTMQDDRFADIAADSGAFGLAKMIEKQLSAQVAPQFPPRSRGGPGEGMLRGPAKQALPQLLPQAAGEK